MVAALVATGVYYSHEDLTTGDETSNQLEVTESDYSLYVEEQLEMPFPKEVLNSTEEATATSDKKATTHTATNASRKANATSLVTENNNKKSKEFTPKVHLPVLEEVTDDAFVSEEVAIPQVSGNDVVGSNEHTPIDVKTINKKSEEIKYKYFDGKLFLYGDFKEEPYEILEINSKTAREIYLYHGRAYYQIEVTDGVKELKPITSQKLINELTIIRNNKVN